MRIDSHQHFWFYNPIRESWISDDMKAIRKDFLPTDLEPELTKYNMDGCVLVQADDSEEETRLLLEFAAKAYFVKAVIGWIDLTAKEAQDRLVHYTQNQLFKGVRHTLQAESNSFILGSDFQKGISCLTDFQLTYDLLVLEHQLEAAGELVRRNPKQAFVLDHMAKPSISRGVSLEWKRGICKLAQYENAFCKVSGFLVETHGLQWKPEDFTPFLEVVWDAFGEDRLLYGSDWPVCLGAGTYADTLRIVECFFQTKGEKALHKIMGSNAKVFYGI